MSQDARSAPRRAGSTDPGLGRSGPKRKKSKQRVKTSPPPSPALKETDPDQEDDLPTPEDDAERENEDSGRESDEEESPPTAPGGATQGGDGRRYTATGGLYGCTSMPTSMPTMPKLGGQTHEDYTEWRPKAKVYFETNSISEVTMLTTVKSLRRAVDADCDQHAPKFLLGMWMNLHKKAAAAIQAATEPVLGPSFFNAIEDEQEQVGDFNLYACNPDEPKTLIGFIQHNANHLWTRIKEKCGTVTPQRLGALMKKYTDLRYQSTQKPEEFRKEFEKIVNDLAQNGTVIPEQCHMAIWYNALPAEYGALKQGLNARKNLTWQDIFEALQSQYSKQRTPSTPRGGEQAHAAPEYGRNGRPKKPLSQIECFNCGQKGHFQSNCQKPRRGDIGGRGAGQVQDKERKRRRQNEDGGRLDESQFEVATPFLDEEVMHALTEPARIAGPGDQDPARAPIHFVFDSAATSHVTPHADIVKNLSDAPEVRMGTALQGVGVSITKRGTVRLSDRWILKDVALLPKASVSLLSEGRLADAGYTITKNKDSVLVTDDVGKVLFRGARSSKLWTYTVDGGKPPAKRPLNTLLRVPDTHKQQEAAQRKRRALLKAGPADPAAGKKDE